MIKKSISKVVVLASLGAALSPALKAETGIYIGAALGGSALTGKSNLALIREIIGGPTPQNFNITISDKNVVGDLFIGYGKRFNTFWVAIEALASFTSLSSKQFLDITPLTTENNGQYLAHKTTNAWGASVNLGHYLNQASRLYIKLGIETRRFNVKFSGNLPPNDPDLLNINKSYGSTAFVPGIGFETELAKCFSVRTEYRMAMYPTKTVQVANSATQFSGVKTKPTIHYFNVGLTFKI